MEQSASLRSRSSRALAAGLPLGLLVLLTACGAKPASVKITPPKLTISGLKKSQALRAEVLDKKGAPIDGIPVSWESGKPSVASVEASGLVRSAGPGSAMLTAKAAELSASVKVTVVDVATVTVAPPRVTLAGAKGSTAVMSAEALDSAGKPVDAKPVWTTSDPKVVTVDENGKLTSVAEGKAAVTASLGDIGASAELRILFREIAAFEVSPQTVPLKVGDTQHLTVVARDASGAVVEDVAVVWSSSDPKTAVCANGMVKAISQGTATVRALCGPRSAEVSVLVY